MSDPKKYKLLFVTLSGREYMATLQATGDFHTQPPFVAWEREDETIEAAEVRYSSMGHLAVEHGLLLTEMVSADPTN
jgi:hypothetical protein